MIPRSKSHFPNSVSFEITTPLSSSVQTCYDFQSQPVSFHYLLSFCCTPLFSCLCELLSLLLYRWNYHILLEYVEAWIFLHILLCSRQVFSLKTQRFLQFRGIFLYYLKNISSFPFLPSGIPIRQILVHLTFQVSVFFLVFSIFFVVYCSRFTLR